MDYTYNTNSGGCCYIAYLIARELEQLGIEYKVVLFSTSDSEDDYDADELECNILNRKHGFGSGYDVVSHYGILVGDILINSGEYEDNASWELSLTSDDLKWIYDTGDWNSVYDRFYNVTAKKLIKTVVNAYKLKHEKKS